jgi:hypothetical protein
VEGRPHGSRHRGARNIAGWTGTNGSSDFGDGGQRSPRRGVSPAPNSVGSVVRSPDQSPGLELRHHTPSASGVRADSLARSGIAQGGFRVIPDCWLRADGVPLEAARDAGRSIEGLGPSAGRRKSTMSRAGALGDSHEVITPIDAESNGSSTEVDPVSPLSVDQACPQ